MVKKIKIQSSLFQCQFVWAKEREFRLLNKRVDESSVEDASHVSHA